MSGCKSLVVETLGYLYGTTTGTGRNYRQELFVVFEKADNKTNEKIFFLDRMTQISILTKTLNHELDGE